MQRTKLLWQTCLRKNLQKKLGRASDRELDFQNKTGNSQDKKKNRGRQYVYLCNGGLLHHLV